jgi:hypothetical protein
MLRGADQSYAFCKIMKAKAEVLPEKLKGSTREEISFPAAVPFLVHYFPMGFGAFTSVLFTDSGRNRVRESGSWLARPLRGHGARACVRMSELFSMLPPWFYILLAVGVLDALIQWSDYRQWRKERGESDEEVG